MADIVPPVPPMPVQQPRQLSELQLRRQQLSRIGAIAGETWTDDEVLKLGKRFTRLIDLNEERSKLLAELHDELVQLRKHD